MTHQPEPATPSVADPVHTETVPPPSQDALPAVGQTVAEVIDETADAVDPNVCLEDYYPHCLTVWRNTLDQHGSLQVYESTVRHHLIPFFKGIPIQTWNRRLMRRFVKRLGATKALSVQGTPFTDGRMLSKGTKKRILAILSGICSIAMDEDELLKENPAKNYVTTLKRYGGGKTRQVRAKRIPKSHALTIEERDRVLIAARKVLALNYYIFLVLLAATGLRPSEAAALRWEDCDLTGRTTNGVPVVYVSRTFKRNQKNIGQPKSKDSRVVELDPVVVELLLELRATIPDNRYGLIFMRPNGKPFRQGFRNNLFALVLGLIGFRRWLGIYCLRHTYASILINKGVSISIVSKQLGHSGDEVTRETYYHWHPNKSEGHLSRLGLGGVVSTPRRPRAA